MAVTVNTTERRVSVSISRGPKGAPFTFEDFTPEQLDDLKLRFSDLTEADKDELKLKFSDLTPEEKEELSLKWEDLTPEQKLELKGEKGDAFTFEDFTVAQLAALKGDKGDPFTYEDFTQEQKDEVFNTFLSNFYDPSIVALNSRGSNEGATFEVKLNKIQNEMNILDPLPSLLMLPSGVKAGKLYSILPEDGSGDFTVERNSTATRVNSEGLIEEVQPNVPRIDYSTGDHMLLVEGEATNLIPDNSNMNTATTAVSKTGSLWNIFSKIYPNEESYFIDGQLAVNFKNIRKSVTTIEGLAYTFSVFVKTLDGNPVTKVDDYLSGDFRMLLEGSDADSYEIKHIKDDIYRVSGTKISSGGTEIYGVYKYTGNNDRSFEFFGFQVEQGTKPTSYIPTTGSVVTRLADNIFQTFPKTGDAVITFADGTTQTISGIQGETFTLPEGVIKKVEML